MTVKKKDFKYYPKKIKNCLEFGWRDYFSGPLGK